VAASCATVQAAGPTANEFEALHAAQCEDHAARARNAHCKAIEEEPTEFKCRYELPETDGSWKSYEAIVALDGANWVWLDGETRCAISAISSLH
jgi:hypothetical protein